MTVDDLRDARPVGTGAATSVPAVATAPAVGRLPRVVIVGAGFGGLAAAKALKRAPVEVTVIDRRNYHLFQPLLYQVATAALSPADIAQPIRGILRRQHNAEVVLGRVTDVDPAAREVLIDDRRRRPAPGPDSPPRATARSPAAPSRGTLPRRSRRRCC